MEFSGHRAHPEFDPKAAEEAYGKIKNLRGEQITSPFDLYSVEKLRTLHEIQLHPGFATDVFVWGEGAAKERYLTQFSGLPYWRKGKSWPCDHSGKPMRFLAQFCFLDSLDIVPELPGDVLLIFVPDSGDEWICDPIFHFEWEKISDAELIDNFPDGVKAFAEAQYYGAISRSIDYPVGEVYDIDESIVRNPLDLGVLNGTKIGGVPHLIQSGFVTYKVDPKTKLPKQIVEEFDFVPPGIFLCQLTSLQEAMDVPFPWTNRREKIPVYYGPGPIDAFQFGDMGSIYVFLTPRKTCVATMEDY